MQSLLMRSRLLEASEKESMAKIASRVYASSAVIGVEAAPSGTCAAGAMRRGGCGRERAQVFFGVLELPTSPHAEKSHEARGKHRELLNEGVREHAKKEKRGDVRARASPMSSTTPAPMTAPPATPGAVPAVASPAPERPRRQLSCLGKGIISCIDGGCFGAAIGAIFSSARAMSSLAAGTESVVGALGMVARSGLQSGLSLGAALGFYSGGVCSLEQFRSKRDLVNPFLVGGIMGAFGAVQRVEVHDGQRKMRVLAYSPRGMAVGALTSGMLCSLFWYIQQPTRREAASPSAGEGVSPPSPQRQTQRPPAPLSTPSLPPAPRGEDWRSRAEVADPYAASQGRRARSFSHDGNADGSAAGHHDGGQGRRDDATAFSTTAAGRQRRGNAS